MFEKPSLKKAFEYYKVSCELDYPASCAAYCRLLIKDNSWKKNKQVALKSLEKGCTDKDHNASVSLKKRKRHAKDLKKSDRMLKEIIRGYSRWCDQDSPKTGSMNHCMPLAKFYLRTNQPQKAKQAYKKACKNGVPIRLPKNER